MKQTFTKEKLHEMAAMVLRKAQMLSPSTASIVTLQGDLGAGKTTLTQEIARTLGITENVISPTFVILKNYELKITNDEWKKQWKKLVHIDAYRLESSHELLKLGWDEVVSDPHNLIILEWPEKVPECVSDRAVCQVMLSHMDEETREIEIVV